MDEIGPKLQELTHRVNTALLESPYRAELERHYGALMFKNLEIAARSFSPAIVELMQEEKQARLRVSEPVCFRDCRVRW